MKTKKIGTLIAIPLSLKCALKSKSDMKKNSYFHKI